MWREVDYGVCEAPAGHLYAFCYFARVHVLDDIGARRQLTQGIVRVCSPQAACQIKISTRLAFHAVPGVASDSALLVARLHEGNYGIDVLMPRWPCSDPAGECAKDYSSPCPADWVEDGVHCIASKM